MDRRRITRALLDAVASLRLTVVLMALGMALVFLGTLAQAQLGVWETVERYFRSPVVWVDPNLLVPRDLMHLPFTLPFPGGLLLGAVAAVNLLAAHARRFSLRRGRTGVLVLHAGLLVLLAGEFVTAFWSEEGLLSLDVDGRSRVVEDLRRVELAVIDPAEPAVDRVITVPATLLDRARTEGTAIEDRALPFAIRIERWVDNARLVRGDASAPALRGIGRDAAIQELPRVRGVDGAQSDAPAALVALYREEELLGRWLLSVDLLEAQAVAVDGRSEPYGISLRYARSYLPFTLHLEEFRHDRFTGTEIARNFSSRIRIEDPDQDTERTVLISMNSPLRYRGLTFYQASYKPDDSGSVLQVVRNPGAFLPYLACILVGLGMAWHFGQGLWRHLRRRQRTVDAEAAHRAPLPRWQRWLPWCVVVPAVLFAASGLLRSAPDQDPALDAVAHWPASAGGRVMPLDAVARHVLLVSSGRQSLRDPATGQEIPPIRFLLDLMSEPERVAGLPLVRVEHPQVLALLDLPAEAHGRLSLATIEPHWDRIAEQAGRALEVDAKRRDPFQRAIVDLYRRVDTLLAHAHLREPWVVAPLHPEDDWRSFRDAVVDSGMVVDPHRSVGEDVPPPAAPHPSVVAYTTVMTAHAEGDRATFAAMAHEYRRAVTQGLGEDMRRARIEVLFNRSDPFSATMALYLGGLALALTALLLRLRADRPSSFAESLRRCAWATILAAFVLHTVAIAIRMYLQGRPPVTNLYSSAIFVGWAAVLFGLLLERLQPLVLGLIGAAMIGFTTLIVAHHLGTSGDTLHMMQAVLDSNLWLATHVVTITLGYSAGFLAGALAILSIVMGLFTTALTRERERVLARMVYGVVCFGLLLSFVGTMLGGIWADQSWGRFWGWDPKENGAALVVLINALILHARWSGMIRERGLMLMAVAGNVVVAWSWFGTNLLGVGLHAYGFTESGAIWLLLFVLAQIIIISMGLVPRAAWRSHRDRIASAGGAGS